MKAILHIGMPKTGTTTIQHFLEVNRKTLKKQSIFVPAFTDTYAGHFQLIAATYCPNILESWSLFPFLGYQMHNYLVREDLPTLEIEKKTITLKDQEKLWERYRHEIETNCAQDDIVIFTAEILSFSQEDEVKRVKMLMDSLFDDVTIVLYLRRQPEHVVSEYYTNVFGTGITWTLGECALPAYDEVIKRWSIFGKDKIKIRIFDKQEFHDGDLLADFALTVGFEMTGLNRVENQNETMADSGEIEFLRLFNSHVPRLLDSWTFNTDYLQIRSVLSSHRKNSKKTKAYYLNREEVQRMLEQCREGNDWIAREYLGREKLFSEDVSMYPEEVASPHGLTLERCAQIMACIYKELLSEKLQQKKEFHSAVSHLQGEMSRQSEEMSRQSEEISRQSEEISRLQTHLQEVLLPRWIGHFIACFIPKKQNRQRFRAKYVKEKNWQSKIVQKNQTETIRISDIRSVKDRIKCFFGEHSEADIAFDSMLQSYALSGVENVPISAYHEWLQKNNGNFGFFMRHVGIDMTKEHQLTDGVWILDDIKLPLPLKENDRDIFGAELLDCVLPSYFRHNFERFDHYCNIIGNLLKDFGEGPYEYGNVFLKEGDVVFDCGANMGLFSATAGRYGCQVFAFEAIPETIDNFLSKTVSMNKNIHIHPFAVWDKEEVLDFSIVPDQVGASRQGALHHEGCKKVIVQAIPLDLFVERSNIKRVDFIKADIEGAERNMLRGAKRILREFAPKLAVCTYHLPDDSQVLREIILEANPNYQIVEKFMKLYAHVPR